jgi:hypothetical protein
LKLKTKITTLAPAEVKLEFAFLVGNEWQTLPFIFRDSPVPAAVGIEYLVRIAAGAADCLVRHADDVEGEVVGRIAQIPFADAVLIVGPVVGGRERIVGIAEPEFGIVFGAVRQGDGIGDGDLAGAGEGREIEEGEQHHPCSNVDADHRWK